MARVKRREVFISIGGERIYTFPSSSGSGENYLPVTEPCGYCMEFICQECPLFQKNLCISDGRWGKHVAFWKFVNIMIKLTVRTKTFDWQKAENYASQIADFITEHGRQLEYLKKQIVKKGPDVRPEILKHKKC